jgi:hypothetical protein
MWTHTSIKHDAKLSEEVEQWIEHWMKTNSHKYTKYNEDIESHAETAE